MSGQKKLEKACRNSRVVAVASRTRTDYVTDEFGQIQHDKSGTPMTKKTQLYNIIKLR